MQTCSTGQLLGTINSINYIWICVYIYIYDYLCIHTRTYCIYVHLSSIFGIYQHDTTHLHIKWGQPVIRHTLVLQGETASIRENPQFTSRGISYNHLSIMSLPKKKSPHVYIYIYTVYIYIHKTHINNRFPKNLS